MCSTPFISCKPVCVCLLICVLCCVWSIFVRIIRRVESRWGNERARVEVEGGRWVVWGARLLSPQPHPSPSPLHSAVLNSTASPPLPIPMSQSLLSLHLRVLVFVSSPLIHSFLSHPSYVCPLFSPQRLLTRLPSLPSFDPSLFAFPPLSLSSPPPPPIAFHLVSSF